MGLGIPDPSIALLGLFGWAFVLYAFLMFKDVLKLSEGITGKESHWKVIYIAIITMVGYLSLIIDRFFIGALVPELISLISSIFLLITGLIVALTLSRFLLSLGTKLSFKRVEYVLYAYLILVIIIVVISASNPDAGATAPNILATAFIAVGDVLIAWSFLVMASHTNEFKPFFRHRRPISLMLMSAALILPLHSVIGAISLTFFQMDPILALSQAEFIESLTRLATLSSVFVAGTLALYALREFKNNVLSVNLKSSG
ncbi:MAG: hypothetical protein IH932_03300 [Thaumarchaeota archaeon]|nr:hypothetical protein [Nitrososphaerota archaeon]